MSYLLDTNAVIALLKDEPAIFRKRLRRTVSRGAAIAVSSIVLYELWYGVARSARRLLPAEPKLILDRGVPLAVGGIAGIERDAEHGPSLTPSPSSPAIAGQVRG